MRSTKQLLVQEVQGRKPAKRFANSVAVALASTVLSLLTIPALRAQSFTALPLTISYFASISEDAVAGDFNGDGILDLAIVSECPSFGTCPTGAVTILLGNGDGTFKTGNTYPTGGAHAYRIVMGDFNSDGKLDLAVASQGTTDVAITVLLGVGDGTFSTGATYSAGPLLGDSLAIGDLNGDGVPDLVVGNPTTVSVLLGNRDGTFQAANSYPVSTGTNVAVGSIAVGDLNKDGNLDIAVSVITSTSDEIDVLLGNGDGTFQPPQSSPSGGTFPGFIAIGDFNGDTISDLAVLMTCGGHPCLGVLLGNGNGTFNTGQTYPIGQYSGGLVAGDFNGDGNIDLAAATACANPTAKNGCLSLPGLAVVFLGNGDGTFQAAQIYASGGDLAENVVVGDFNGDGRPDLAIVNGQDSFGNLDKSEIGVLLSINPFAVLGLSPTSISFSPQIIGTSSTPKTVTLTNAGTVAINVAGVVAVGANSNDFVITNSCPITLSIGMSCTANVVFKPSTTTSENASLTVSTTAPVEPHVIPITAAGGDFSVGPANGQPTSVTFAAGQSATLNLQVNPIGAFTGAVSLSCSGAIPQGTCTASPSSVNVTGTATVPFTVTVTTTARSAVAGSTGREWPSSRISQNILATLAAFSLLAGCMLWLSGRPRLGWAPLSTAILLAALTGCGGSGGGGGGNSGTPPGTYNLTVSGTQQGVSRTLGLTLTVN